MADAAVAARAGQKTPAGYSNMERMLKRVLGRGRVLICGNCMDARGIKDDDLMEGAKRSTMDEFAHGTLIADKVLIF